MTEYKKYQLLKDIVLPGRIIPEGAIYEEYHTGRSYVNNREPYKPHFISPATIRQYPDWFKGIPPQPSSIDRIEVSTLVGKEKYADPRCTDFIYSFESNSIISPSNFHAIKQAIEQVLNESDTIDIDWSSKPVTEKYYKQSEVDTIRKESFDAGRNHNGTPKYGFVVWEYPTLQDYLNSLSKETKPKEEDKPVLFTTEDGVEITKPDEVVYFYDDDWNLLWSNAIAPKIPNVKYFYHQASSDKYLLENKPSLSLNEVMEVVRKSSDKNFINTILLDKAKQKLKQ